MKNLLVLLFTMLLTSCSNDDNPATYSPYEGSVVLKSQADVDDFVSYKPGSVIGDVTIGYAGSQSDITDISGMATLSGIQGKLTIINNPLLTSLQGLENLKEIQKELRIENNPQLTSLQGLESLTKIESFTSIYLVISNNAALTSVEGLENLAEVKAWEFEVSHNPALTSLEGLQGIKLSEKITITNNNSLQNINGLRSLEGFVRHMTIAFNPQLETLEGLEGVTSVELFDINNCNGLKSCTDFENCTIRNFSLGNCPQFDNFETMSNVTFSSIFLAGNSSVSSLSGLTNFTEGGRLKIYDCPQVTSLQDLDGSTLQNIELQDIGITSLHGLENLELDSVILSFNSNLQSLEGLNTGHTTFKQFWCANNESLGSLDGLMHVSQIDELTIRNNNSLVNLNGLQNLTKAIYVFITGNASLESVEQLQSLTTVGRNIEFGEMILPTVLSISGNDMLETLNGIENITSLKGRMVFANNSSLKDLCAVLSITGFVGEASIQGNYNPATYDELMEGAACSIE